MGEFQTWPQRQSIAERNQSHMVDPINVLVAYHSPSKIANVEQQGGLMDNGVQVHLHFHPCPEKVMPAMAAMAAPQALSRQQRRRAADERQA